MLLIKKLYDLKFDFSILPADISKDIDLLRQLTKGTFEYQSQKIEILDNAIFDAIHALYYDDTSVREVFLMWMNDQQIFSNDGINTIVSDEVVEANLENPETYTIFVKDLTRDEIQHIISGTSKIGYATTIKAAADYLRISESADSEDSGSQNIKLNEAQRLNSFITENNLWFPKKDLGIFLERGAEQKVYFSDDKYIIKTNDCHFYNSWHDYFYSLLLHNYFFPDTTYELIGFIQDHNLLFSVVRQTFITEDRETDLKFVKKFMAANGFENTRNNDYYSPSLGIILEDLHDENVLTEDGVLCFVDTVFYIKDNMTMSDGGSIENEEEFIQEIRQLTKNLECDGSTRVIHYLLNEKKIPHKTMYGSVTVEPDSFTPHYWIELSDERIIDLKSRMWLGEKAQEGIFEPNENLYEGEEINMPVSKTLFDILTKFDDGGNIKNNRKKIIFYHGVKKTENVDKILKEGFNLFHINPLWQNDYAISVTKNPNAVRKFFAKKDISIIKIEFDGVIVSPDDVRAIYSSSAQDYTRQIVESGIDAVGLDGSFGQAFIYNLKAIKKISLLPEGAKKELGGNLTNVKKAYLITLEEYIKDVAPLLKEFKLFLKKNPYFINIEYGGYGFLSYAELVEAKNNKQKISSTINFSDDKENKWQTADERLEYKWNYHTEREPKQRNATPEIIAKKNEYISKLNEIFDERYVKSSLGDADNSKSNKRAIRYAIDYDVYKKLLESGTVDIDLIRKVAESAGVKLPKKIIESMPADRLNEEKYAELYKTLPSINREKLKELVGVIDSSMTEFIEELFVKEKKRSLNNINDIKSLHEITVEGYTSFDYKGVFESLERPELRIETIKYKDKHNYEHEKRIYYFNVPALTANWEQALDKGIRQWLESLKYPLFESILSNFVKISEPIKNIIQLDVSTSAGEYIKGEFRFEFENGSKFDYDARAITAGGYNIQRFHFRYITDFKDVVLADGTKTSSASLYQIVENFSTKEELEIIKNPYIAVRTATSTEQIIDRFSEYLKTHRNINGQYIDKIRKDKHGVSFKMGIHNKYFHFYSTDKNKRNELMPLIEAKEQAIKYLQWWGIAGEADLPDLKLNAGGNIDTPDKSLEYLAMQKYIDKALDNLSRSSRTVNAIIDTSSSANKSEVIVSDSPTDIAIQAKENYTETLEYLYSVKNKKFTQFYGAEEVLEFVDDINKRINDGIVKDGILLRDEDSDKFPYTLVADLPEARNQFANEFYDRVNSSDAQKSAAWIHWRINFTDHFFADGCGKTADALAFFILTRHNSELPTFPANQSEWFAHASKKRRNPSNPRSYYDMSWLNWVFFYKSLFK